MGPSRGGMFGCNAAQAHIIIVDVQPQMMLNKERVEVDEASLLHSPRG